MSNTKYNGWTNYATWRVNLEIFDGFDSSDLLEYHGEDAYEMGMSLKEIAENYLEEQGSGLTLDYAMAFLNEVNWYEIASNIIESEKEEA